MQHDHWSTNGKHIYLYQLAPLTAFSGFWQSCDALVVRNVSSEPSVTHKCCVAQRLNAWADVMRDSVWLTYESVSDWSRLSAEEDRRGLRCGQRRARRWTALQCSPVSWMSARTSHKYHILYWIMRYWMRVKSEVKSYKMESNIETTDWLKTGINCLCLTIIGQLLTTDHHCPLPTTTRRHCCPSVASAVCAITAANDHSYVYKILHSIMTSIANWNCNSLWLSHWWSSADSQ